MQVDIATIGCGVSLKAEAGILTEFRIAFGVAGPVPMRCPDTETEVKGVTINDALFDTISRTIVADVNPRTSWRASKDFRINIIKELSKRATQKAIDRAVEEAGK